MSAFGPVFPTPELSVTSPYRGLAFVNAQELIDTIRRTLRMIHCSFRLIPVNLLSYHTFEGTAKRFTFTLSFAGAFKLFKKLPRQHTSIISQQALLFKIESLPAGPCSLPQKKEPSLCGQFPDSCCSQYLSVIALAAEKAQDVQKQIDEIKIQLKS